MVPKITASIETEQPNKNLYEFKGLLTLGGESFPLTEQNLLLKGSRIMNTERGVLGIVVYTGKDTKVM